MKIVKINSTENCHFYSREKSLNIAWACFHNVPGPEKNLRTPVRKPRHTTNCANRTDLFKLGMLSKGTDKSFYSSYDMY